GTAAFGHGKARPATCQANGCRRGRGQEAIDPMASCRIVLVRTHYAGNLGATARVMHNFALTDVVLVDPQADIDDREARRLSTHGEFILDQARIEPDLASAVADCTLVAGTSALTSGLSRGTGSGTVRALIPPLVSKAGAGRLALVFGPEPSGLTNEEVGLCHYLLTIPTAPEYRALNLAQAVGICLYELHLAARMPQRVEPTQHPVASYQEQERMFEHLRQALEAIHFLYGPKADALLHALRHVLGRAQLSPLEV